LQAWRIISRIGASPQWVMHHLVLMARLTVFGYPPPLYATSFSWLVEAVKRCARSKAVGMVAAGALVAPVPKFGYVARDRLNMGRCPIPQFLLALSLANRY
jgi:hypothetical protein